MEKKGNYKIPVCFICCKKLKYKPTRIQLMKYGIKGYNQYSPWKRFDLCKECYNRFIDYIKEEKLNMKN